MALILNSAALVLALRLVITTVAALLVPAVALIPPSAVVLEAPVPALSIACLKAPAIPIQA